jgi:hypothetical protein
LDSLIEDLKINSILDLACGLNPLALANQKRRYFASDIDKNILSLIKKFFKKNKIKGKVFSHDIRDFSRPLPQTELCLILKTLDIIEKNPYPLTKKLLESLNCKYIIISFSTKTLSGKQMKKPKRIWLRRLLKKLGYKYKIFSSHNEIFYLIEKPESNQPSK